MIRDLSEIPLTSATALDMALAGTRTRSAVQKLRQELRRILGAGRGFSIGSLGTIQVENVAMLPCLETAGRWNRGLALRLTEAYLTAGLDDLIRSASYTEALQLTGQAIQAEARSLAAEKSGIVAHVVTRLVHQSPIVREVATHMHEIHLEVDRQLPEFRRLPGQLVRVEGEEALTVLDDGGEERLRAVDAAYLRSLGIEESGDFFVLQRLQWSPDVVASVYVPAVDLQEDELQLAQLAAGLEAAETPLPAPSAPLA